MQAPLRALVPLILIAGVLPSIAQSSPGGSASISDLPACTLEKKVYTCSLPALKQALAATHTVNIVSDPDSRAADAALASLAKSLDKSVTKPDETAADLTFRLTPTDAAGVRIGPATTELARLRVSVNTPGDPNGKLIWSEAYVGQVDMPWPTVVRALIRQFKDKLGVK